MDADFTPGTDPEEIKDFLHHCGLIPLNEYYTQVKKMLKRQRQSPQTINEQVQKRLAENGIIHKDDSSKNTPLLCPRKRTSFSPVITRKRGKAIKKRTPSATQVASITTTVISSTTINSIEIKSKESVKNEPVSIDEDQPLDLRLRT